MLMKKMVVVCALLLAGSISSAAQDQSAHRIRVGGNVQAAKIVEQAEPIYPGAALEAKISGTVVLHAVVDTDGSVKEVSHISGPKELAQSAIDAVQQWKYQTTLLNGEPVEVDTTISVVYQLSDSGVGTVLDGQAQQSQAMEPPVQRYRVGGNVMAARMVKQVQPKYPKAAKKAGITGAVLLHVIITKDGSVTEIQYVSGPEELAQSAMDAVRQWKYQPMLINGKPVEVDSTIKIVFTLGNQE